MFRKFCALLMILLMFALPACAETISLQDGGLELMDSSVRYPQIAGMDDPALMEKINGRILEALDIRARLDRLPLLMQSPVPLTVRYDAMIEGNVLSCIAESEGAVVNNRSTHVWNAVTIDLATGRDVTLSDIFTDEPAALEAIVLHLEEDVAPELSAHLSSSQLTPLPELFALDATGVTFYYPIDQLATLSDRAGAVRLLWSEWREYLNLAEGSILDRIGAKAMLNPDAQALRTAVESGSLPGIPLTLGASVQEATDAFGLLTDPDLYQDGRMFALEGAAFRQVWLLTDALTEHWDHSVIKGLLLDRVNLYGLYTGMPRSEAQAFLGQPGSTVTLDADAADSYRLTPGVSDYYDFSGVQLRLHYDGEGLLYSLIITLTD